jgi:hypothetical protein
MLEVAGGMIYLNNTTSTFDVFVQRKYVGAFICRARSGMSGKQKNKMRLHKISQYDQNHVGIS